MHKVADFGYLTQLQRCLLTFEDLPDVPNAPKSAEEWKKLNSDLCVLVEHFSFMKTFDHQTGHRVTTECYYNFVCPLVLRSMPQVDETGFVASVLSELGISLQYKERYEVRRIPFSDRDAIIGYMVKKLRLGSSVGNQWAAQMAGGFYDACRAEGMDELIDLQFRGVGPGVCCDICVCRRAQVGRVMGWVFMIDDAF